MGLFDFLFKKEAPKEEVIPVHGADFSDYLKTATVKKGDGGHTTVYNNGMGDLAVRILQAKFPDYVRNVNTKVTADMPVDGSSADYGGLGGDKINAGKLNQWISYNDETDKSLKSDPKKYRGTWGANSDDVMDTVAKMLHELYHSRSEHVGKYGEGAGQDWKNMLKDAAEADFPSLKSGLGGLMNGDSLNEFLATATALKAMKAADVQPTKRFKELESKLTALEAKYPWLPAYLDKYGKPEMLDRDGKQRKTSRVQYVDPAYKDPFGDSIK